MNDQVPVIVCTAGLAVNEKVDVVPLDDSEQGVARTPVVRSSVEGVQAGETPVPCKYRELAADSTTGTPADPQTSAPRASAIAPTTTHPIGRWGWNFEGGLGLISEVEEPAGERLSPSPTAARWPNSQRRGRQQALGHRHRQERNAGLLDEGADVLVGLGVSRALAEEDERLFGLAQQGERAGDRFRRRDRSGRRIDD